MPWAEVLAHAEERVAGAHHHAADGDGAHDEAPDRTGLSGPEGLIGHGAGRNKLRHEGRPAEEEDERNQQTPGDDAAGEVQRGQARADDVADAEIGRADRGRGEGGGGAGAQLGRRRPSVPCARNSFPTRRR